MRVALRSLLAGVSLLFIAAPALGGESSLEGCYQVERLFDGRLPAAEAAQQMEWLRASAERGGKNSAYYLGTLYRLGHAHPARRVPQDLAQARHWLTQSALAGGLGAMAGLAELELAESRPREALVIIRVREHYAKRYPEARMAELGNYPRFLRRRAEVALMRQAEPVSDADIQADIDAFIATHGAGIEARITKPGTQREGASCPPFYDTEKWPLVRRGTRVVHVASERTLTDEPAYAWLVPLVNAKGRVDDVLVVDFAATPEELRVLRGIGMSQRYNRLPGAPTRSARFPINLR